MKGEIPAIQGQTFEPYSETSSRSLSIPIKELGINHNLRRPRNDVLPILVTNSVNESTARERGIVVTTSSSEVWLRREAPAPHRPVSELCSDYVACQSSFWLLSRSKICSSTKQPRLSQWWVRGVTELYDRPNAQSALCSG